MNLPFQSPPDSLCIVRLSAVGDICHTLPVVRTIQKVWPTTRLTWVIGRLEASLVGDIPNINFVIFDKSKGTAAYTQLYRHMRHRSFDALLHMQMSIRSSLVNRLIPSRIRLGFDRPRAKDLQWLFNNAQIPSHKNQHVIDSFFGFTEALGIDQKILEWDIPLMDSHLHFTEQYIDSNRPYLVISPCSAMSYRNWNAQGYAAICDYVSSKGVQPILTGGPSEVENTLGEQICTLATEPVTNLIGKTNLKQLLATLKSAIAVISPDSGPAHMATAVNTPVIGLYACTNPDRARPYLSQQYTISHYDEAVLDKYGKPVSQLPWGIRVRDPGTMDRITVDDVKDKINLLLANRAKVG